MQLELFGKGFFQFLRLVILPILIGFFLLLWLLGTTFLWASFLFGLGTLFLLQTFRFLNYRPAWLKWIDQLRMLHKPQNIVYFAISLFLLIALMVFAISWTVSARFCIISFGAYATVAWVIYRIVAANILIYAHFLSEDTFNVPYWFYNPPHFSKNSSHPNLFKRGIALFIEGLLYYKNVKPIDQIKTIDILFKRKHYQSLIDIQYYFFRAYVYHELKPAVQKRILLSIHELQNILKVQNFKLQEKQVEQLRFFETIQDWQLKIILSKDLLNYWFALAISSDKEPQKSIHYLLIQNLYDQLGAELSKLVAAPKDYYLDGDTLKVFRNQEVTKQVEIILKNIPFEAESHLGQSIRYVYSLIFVTNGILNLIDN